MIEPKNRLKLDDNVIDKEIHPKASKLMKDYSTRFQTSLCLQAKLVAYLNNADIVLTSHVDEALAKINTTRNTLSWLHNILMVIGSALFGAFIQGFVTELWTGNITLTVVYTSMGFVGIFMIFWVLRK